MTASQSSESTQSPLPASPNYRFSFEPESQRVIAQFQGVTLADSKAAKLLTETGGIMGSGLTIDIAFYMACEM